VLGKIDKVDYGKNESLTHDQQSLDFWERDNPTKSLDTPVNSGVDSKIETKIKK